MQFTKRDGEIIKFLARHKFATVEQIANYMKMGIKVTYRRLNKLKKNKYLRYEQIFAGKPGIYRPTLKGIMAADVDIKPAKVVLGTYWHDLQVVNLALMFYSQGYVVETEREIMSKQNKGIGQTGKQERIPDLVVTKNEKSTIAVELELAKKSPGRLNVILNYYARQRRYEEVWFYCQKESVMKTINDYSRKAEHIKVFKCNGGENSVSDARTAG